MFSKIMGLESDASKSKPERKACISRGRPKKKNKTSTNGDDDEYELSLLRGDGAAPKTKALLGAEEPPLRGSATSSVTKKHDNVAVESDDDEKPLNELATSGDKKTNEEGEEHEVDLDPTDGEEEDHGEMPQETLEDELAALIDNDDYMEVANVQASSFFHKMCS